MSKGGAPVEDRLTAELMVVASEAVVFWMVGLFAREWKWSGSGEVAEAMVVPHFKGVILLNAEALGVSSYSHWR